MITLPRQLPRFRCVLALVAMFVTQFPLIAKAASEPIDDNAWTAILQQYVDDKGFVDYSGLLANRESFDGYISSIEKISPKSDPGLFPEPAQALAYYINAYNAMVFKGVLDRGPEQKSVWKGLISGLNFFVRMDITVGGEVTNLKDLEDDVVRDEFKDPRIHAALNCASIGCPRLIREAYDSDMLQQQLDDAMAEFLNGDMHVLVDDERKRVGLSKIFDWFEEDFIEYEARNGNSNGSKSKRLIDYVNRYRQLQDQIPDHYKVYILEYDKRINSYKKRASLNSG